MTPAELDQINRERVLARVLSSAVHDARNALQGISGSAELLTMGGAAAQVDERARGIMRQSAWLGERFELLLRLGQDTVPSSERIDAARVVQSAIDLRSASWGRLNVSVVTKVPPGTLVRADSVRLIRVLANLMLNAERSLVGGGGTLTVSGWSDAGRVRLVVEDSGPGVDADAEPLLFTSTSARGRVATGLCVSRRLVEEMGGTLIWLGPERRAAFELVLPIG